MAFQELLNPIFSPLLKLNPFFAILLISFLISLFIVLIYKKFTDQNLMKQLKTEIKEHQKQMKELKNHPEKMMKVQKKAMETNTKYMMHSFKPTLFTFIPIILIFGWLNAHMGYYPLEQGDEFTVTAFFDEGADGTITMESRDGITLLDSNVQDIRDEKAEWVLKGDAGTYSIDYKYDNQEFDHRLVIVEKFEDRDYAKPKLKSSELGIKDTDLDEILISNKKVQPLKQIPLIGSIPWIGNFGWLGTYILFSITFSIILRKVLKVY